jgi:hypothetical protein
MTAATQVICALQDGVANHRLRLSSEKLTREKIKQHGRQKCSLTQNNPEKTSAPNFSSALEINGTSFNFLGFHPAV